MERSILNEGFGNQIFFSFIVLDLLFILWINVKFSP